MQNFETLIMTLPLERERAIRRRLDEGRIRQELNKQPARTPISGNRRTMVERSPMANGPRSWIREGLALLRSKRESHAAAHWPLMEAPGER